MTEKQKSEVWKHYDTWLHAYLNADVKTYDAYFDDDYHFIGSTNNEEFLNRKSTTQFFEDTAEQLAGKCDLRNESKILETFGDSVILNHFFDAWFLNDGDYVFYGRFRFSSVLQKKKDGWRFVLQHFSVPDSKSDDGQTIGFENINEENRQLKEAIKRRTKELEAKNRELEIETALERIRAQAVAMKQSIDLLDIVVTLRNEFIKLGHEAHYFWHMMWLPEIYEKAMTSGDGSKIGFVMNLPRHMHGDIPQLAKWEKSKKPTVVHAMNVEEAIAYVDKMVALGDFKNIDPQAPTHDDIKHIGGLTFIMARTTHGEIGYSLPGVVKNPPKEDIDILIKFAGAFDLAHRRFLDIKKAEKQAREVEIQLALEKIRSRSLAVHKSEEFNEVISVVFEKLKELNIPATAVGIGIQMEGSKDLNTYVCGENEKGLVISNYRLPYFNNKISKDLCTAIEKQVGTYVGHYTKKQKDTFYEYILKNTEEFKDLPEDILNMIFDSPSYTITMVASKHVVFNVNDFEGKELSKEDIEIVKRVSKVFNQAYTRFLDLQKAEEQARKSQIELSLERIRSQVTSMQASSDLFDIVVTMRKEFLLLGHEADYFWHMNWGKDNYEMSMTAEDGGRLGMVITVPKFVHEEIKSLAAWERSKKPSFVLALNAEDAWDYIDNMNTHGHYKQADPNAPSKEDIQHIGGLTFVIARTTHGELGFSLAGKVDHPPKASIALLERFASVFDLAYKRFEDLQKSEQQTRETQIELALEKVRSRTMAMQHSDELAETSLLLFEQFKNLGDISDQISIGIINEEAKLMELYSTVHGKQWKDVAKIDLNEPVVMKKIHTGWKKKKKSLVIDLNGTELKKYNSYRKKLSNLTYEEKRWVIHVAFFSNGALTFSSTEPYPTETIHLLERFASVFDGTYRRFLDLKKAEAQAREAQIEAALERVRSRSMAMHNSEELNDVIQVLYDQFIQLNVSIDHAGFILDYKENDDMHIWLADHNAVFPKIVLPYFDCAHWNDFVKAKKTGQKFFANQLDFKEKNKFYHDLFKHIPDLPEETKATYLGFKGLAISTVLLDNVGLYIENYKGIPFSDEENAILMRFGTVFQQSYTRFLDLQKAEAQAREARIETALERVRSRSMAMHNSDELREAGDILFNEITNLGIESITSGFVILEEDENIGWNYAPNPSTGKIMPVAVGVYHKETPIMRSVLKNWKKQEPVFVVEMDEKQTIAHQTFIAERSINFPISAKELIAISPKKLKLHNFNFEQGYLLIVGGTRLTNEQIDIMKRFTKVFQQTYTRFLDLQKAEAQAREAKIETALERVRSRSMAMHKSEELLDVITVVSQQLQELNFKFVHVSFAKNDHSQNYEFWTSAKGLEKPMQFKTPYLEIDVFKKLRAAQKKSLSFCTDIISKEEHIKWHTHLLKHGGSKVFSKEDNAYIMSRGMARSTALNPNIMLILANYASIPYSEEENKIIARFGKVFEQSYTRFLDLQKAEKQTREAQIQLALERVRARTMAMKGSEELVETSELLFQQIKELGIDVWSCGYSLWYDDDSYFIGYNPMPDGKMGEKFKIPLTEDTFFKTIRKGKRDGKNFIVFESKGKSLAKTYDYMDKLPVVGEGMRAIVAAGFELPKFQVTHCGYFSHGHLMFITHQHYPEAIDIFKRFTKEFEQTYTRFLDLQKAEAQARNAQIEASLERVRAKAMAMHDSNELDEVLSVLCEQFDVLGIVPMSTHMTVFDFENNTFTFRETGKFGNRSFGEQTVALDAMDNWKETVDKWKEDKATAINKLHFPKEQLAEVWKVFHESFSSMPEGSRITPSDYPDGIYHTAGKHPFGYIGMNQTRPATEEEEQIVIKFANEFGMAYQRFLDLQKAEAQAREAEIEAALERIRSRSMAMHKTDELSEVIVLLFRQLELLNLVIDTCYIDIFDEDNRAFNIWVGTGTAIYPKQVHLPYFKHPIHQLNKKARQKNVKFFSFDEDEKSRDLYFEHFYTKAEGIDVPKERKEHIAKGLGISGSTALGEHAGITMWNYRKIIYSREENEILNRVNKVFQQTYTRFLDLQKAEAQARESQIEAALERVRSASMAMHKSEELRGVVNTLYGEFQNLQADFNVAVIQILDDTKDLHLWVSTADGLYDNLIHWPYVNMPHFNKMHKAWTEKIPLDITLSKTETQAFFDEYFKIEEVPAERKKAVESVEQMNIMGFYQNHTGIFLMRYSEGNYSEEEKDITQRFSKVFEQTYIRFLDLQKAEAQAREAKIEAALEKVRSQSLAMHNTNEMQTVANEILNQMMHLGLNIDALAMSGVIANETDYDVWIGGSNFEKPIRVAYNNNTKVQRDYNKAIAKRSELFTKTYSGKTKDDYFDFLLNSNTFSPELTKLMLECSAFTTSLSFMKHSGIQIVRYTNEPFSEEYNLLLKRFAKVFEQAYIRFLDLQKVEAQNREAQIELGLEKVRARTMAMQTSDELPQAANDLFLEVQSLGIPAWSAGYNILSEDKTHCYCFMSSEGEIQEGFKLPLNEHESFIPWYNALKEEKEFFVYSQAGDDLVAHYEYMKTLPDLKETFEQFEIKGLDLPTEQHNHLVRFSKGFLLFITYESVPNAHDIFKRFGQVFEQTYTRFLDLKRAEKQARESKIEAALEKVRSQSLSMQKPDELNDVVQLIAEKLQDLDVILDLGGVVICTYFPDSKNVLHWIATPDSESSGKFLLPYFDHVILRDTWASKNKGDNWFSKSYTIEEKNSFFEHAFLHSDYKYFPDEAKADILNKQHHTLSFAWSKNSALLIPSYSGVQPTEDEKAILIRFATVFEHAYIRFMDLQQREIQAKALFDEKQRLENTLSELQTTQKQLIQSEKMASLGELTAGIAHEIQNPLNFVNNFSEVSKELIEEMQEELDNGDMVEVKAIMEDVIQNLDKINHHGKRADGIVKGMLQHSRASGDKKEATDINKLADEYMRLAYHGLRAKNKQFNATLVTDFDLNLPNIKVIPQDLGRVILNLFTNAFYAVDEKKSNTKDTDYEPTVSVASNKNIDTIEITVKDNGNGIPKHVLDKIFQPFFTTKPTGQGTGLGLSMSYDIITKGHGGTLEVETKEGTGTEFIIKLPLKLS